MPVKEVKTTRVRKEVPVEDFTFENSSSSVSRPLIILLVIMTIGVVCAILYFFSPWFRGNNDVIVKSQVEDLQIKTSNPEVGEIIQKVSRHILLPSGDVTVSTVTDADKLRQGNPFFYQSAKAGDKILVYSDRAILYDSTKDIILNIVYIVNPPTSTPTSTQK